VLLGLWLPEAEDLCQNKLILLGQVLAVGQGDPSNKGKNIFVLMISTQTS
jgi:hypothetical protein